MLKKICTLSFCLMIFTLFAAGQPKVIIDFKPGARIECEPDSPITVNLLDFAEVKVDTIPAKPLFFNTGWGGGLDIKGQIPKGWNGKTALPVTVLLKPKEINLGNGDGISLIYICTLNVSSNNNRHDGKPARTTTGRTLLVHSKINAEMSSLLAGYCHSEDGVSYIPRLPVGGWMDSVFVFGSAGENFSRCMFSLGIGPNWLTYDYGNYGSGSSGRNGPDLSFFRKFLDFGTCPFYILPTTENPIPLTRFGETFDLADSATIWTSQPPESDIYFTITGHIDIPNAVEEAHQRNGYEMPETLRSPAVIKGKFPAGWKMGDSVMVTAILSAPLSVHQIKVRFNELAFYKDPDFSVPHLPNSFSSWSDGGSMQEIPGLEKITCPTLTFAKERVSFARDSNTAVVQLRLSAPLDKPLEIPLDFKWNDKVVFSLEKSPVTIPAGETTVDIRVQRIPRPNERDQAYLYIAIDDLIDKPRETQPLFSIPPDTGCTIAEW